MKNKLKVYFKNLEAKRENIYIKKKQKGTLHTNLNFCEAYDCSLELFFSETRNS
jgi:hypothetical protein